MFSRVIFPIFILSTALLALADPGPTEPSPNKVYTATCHIAWTPDLTGNWKTTYIELMTGDNINMVHLTTVAKVDGTATPGVLDFPCPAVTLNSAVYFYQFSSPMSPNRVWTGRFAITDATGATVPPPNANQPDGQPIAWGTGALADPTKATPPPPYLGGPASSNAPTSASTSALAVPSTMTGFVTVSSSRLSSGFATPSSSDSSDSPTATSSISDPSPSAAVSSSNSGNALVLGAVSARAVQAGVALAVIAGTFTFIV